jgi:hypothetical protein
MWHRPTCKDAKVASISSSFFPRSTVPTTVKVQEHIITVAHEKVNREKKYMP